MKKKKRLLLLVLAALALVFTAVCVRAAQASAIEKFESYYITGSTESREKLSDLFTLLTQGNSSALEQFAVIREIANTYARMEDYGRLIHFLCSRTIIEPGDPYNSYYLLMAAYAYLQQDAAAVAARYFDLIVKNYPDLTINGESIHLACLNQLIELETVPERQVWYYQELISRFSDRIDLGVAYFMLAQAYERTGEWNSAMQTYTQYMPYGGTIVPGFPNAYNYAKQQVDFSKSSKDWTFESLPALLRAVQSAMDNGSSYRLSRCQAKANFFARSWEQGETDDSGMADFNLSNYMWGGLQYADKLDDSSNSTEAYLRTTGWSRYISTWYLYFRKVYFPSNPEIHGRWEWAGVYYGEKF